MQARTLVIGAAVIDIIVNIDRLPKTGDDIYGELEEVLVGGCGYNVQRLLTQAAVAHDFFCPIGEGPYADIIRNQFQKEAIQILVEDERMDNGWNIAFVEADGERTFLSVPGVETHWQADWQAYIPQVVYDYIYLSGYELEGESGWVILDWVTQMPDATIIFDPSPRAAFLNRELLQQIYALSPIIHANQAELFALSQQDTYDAAVHDLYSYTQNDIITTMGGQGARYYDGVTMTEVPAEASQVVDTIGAGDAHTAGFIIGKSRGLSSLAATKLGNQVAGQVVAQRGASLAQLHLNE